MYEETAKLIEIFGVVENFKKNLTLIQEQSLKELAEEMTPEEVLLVRGMMAKQLSNMDFSLMVKESAKLYESLFSREEIASLVELYTQNPILMKLLENQQTILSGSMAIADKLAEDADRRGILADEAFSKFGTDDVPQA